MTAPVRKSRIEELVRKATTDVQRRRWFEAERLTVKALGMARSIDDLELMATIVPVLRDARAGRFADAVAVGTVSIVQAAVNEDTPISIGCYLVQPPQVGADARRMRLLALHGEVPLAVVCREPITRLGECPIVAISPGTTIRAKVDPPDDLEHPDLEWFIWAHRELGDWAIHTLDAAMDPLKRVDTLIEMLGAMPEHEGLHEALQESCTRAARERVAK